MNARIICGDCLDVLAALPDESVNCCVTSPPYWGQRDYHVDGQVGLEDTLSAYVDQLTEVLGAVRRVLADDGVLWLNLGDAFNDYNGNAGPGGKISRGKPCDTQRPKLKTGHGLMEKTLKPKDLLGAPWRVALAAQADGWYLRSDTIWHKPRPMPESVRDRPAKCHEYLFLFSKSQRYWFDWDKLPRWARHDVWTVPTTPYPGAHFATFPKELVQPCIRAGCPPGGTVLDPFAGSGTVGAVTLEEGQGRNFVGVELNPEYVGLIEKRLASLAGLRRLSHFGEAEA